jgi:hypothetical protein
MRSMVRDAALVAAAVSALQGLPVAPPSHAQTCSVELAIDRPADGAEVSARDRITGWALDRAASQGTGIEAVRVALDVAPDRADDQVYLPVVYGIDRADVAYALGTARFTQVGFAQDWAAVGAPPGQHRLLLQVKSACGWTSLTRTVRVAGESSASTITQEIVVAPADPETPAPLQPVVAAPAAPAPASALDRVPAIPYYSAPRLTRFALTATSDDPTSAALSWSPVSGVATYAVYVADDSPAAAPPGPAGRLLGLGGLQRVQNGIVGTETTVGGLSAGEPYRFVVRGLAETGGEIAESDSVRVTLPAGAPSVLSGAPSGPGGVALSWGAVPSAAAYSVLAGVANGPLVPDPQRATVPAPAVTVDRLAPGVYAFQVEARDAAGGRLTRSNVLQVVIDPAGVARVLDSGPPAGSAAPGGSAAAAPPASSAPASAAPVAATGAPAGPPAPGAAPAPVAATSPASAPAATGAPPAPSVAPAMAAPSQAAGLALPGVAAAPTAPSPAGAPSAALPPAGPAGAAGANAGPGAASFTVNLTRSGTDGATLEWQASPRAASYAVYQAQGSTPLAFAFTSSRPSTTLVGLPRGVTYSFQVRARDGQDREFAASNTVTLDLSR